MQEGSVTLLVDQGGVTMRTELSLGLQTVPEDCRDFWVSQSARQVYPDPLVVQPR